MSSLSFYQDQAALQQQAADTATLQNVRERCQRAADAWSVLAERTERADNARALIASDKLLSAVNENPDRGLATIR